VLVFHALSEIVYEHFHNSVDTVQVHQASLIQDCPSVEFDNVIVLVCPHQDCSDQEPQVGGILSIFSTL
jgi:hypothetical protein